MGLIFLKCKFLQYFSNVLTSKLNWPIFDNLHIYVLLCNLWDVFASENKYLYCSPLIHSLTLDQMDELTKEVLRSDCGSKNWNPHKNFLDMKKKCHFQRQNVYYLDYTNENTEQIFKSKSVLNCAKLTITFNSDEVVTTDCVSIDAKYYQMALIGSGT